MYKDVEKRRAKAREYYAANRKKILAYHKKWGLEHPLEVAQYRLTSAKNKLRELTGEDVD